MGRATALGEASANRGDAILRETLRLFAQRGLHATSMRDIARAVGLTEGTLYHYHDSKAAIVAAIVEENFFKAGELATALARRAGCSLSEQLITVAESFYVVLSENRAATAFFLSEASRLSPDASTTKIRKRFGALFGERVERLAKHLANLKPAGDPRLLAAHFFDSLGSFWILEAIVAKSPPSEARWRTYATSIAQLIAASCAQSGRVSHCSVKPTTGKSPWQTKSKR
jgi:AcrR family transcriptional regulator